MILRESRALTVLGGHPGGRLLLLVLLLVATASCAHSPFHSPAAAVCPIAWDPPQLLEHDGGKPVAINGGLASVVRGRRMLLSSFALYWLERDQMADTIKLKDSAYVAGALPFLTSVGGIADDLHALTPISPPDSILRMGRVVMRSDFQIAAWSSSQIGVAFLAGDSVSTKDRSAVMTRLELADFDGDRWFNRDRVETGPGGRSLMLPARRAGKPWRTRSFAFDMAPSGRPHFNIVLVKRGSRWITSKLDSTGSTFATSLAELADGTLVLTTLLTVGDVAGWYARRGTVVGDRITWSSPVLIDAVNSSVSPYTWAHLGGDSLLLVWRRDPTETAGPAVRVALSADGGRSWSAHEEPSLADAAGGFIRLAVDSSGTAHLTFLRGAREGVLNSPGDLMSSSRVRGSWTRPVAVSQEETDTSQDFWALADGSLLASWLKIRAFTPRGIIPTSYVAVGRPRCAP